MRSRFVLRVSSQLLSAVAGGAAMFNLFYAAVCPYVAELPDPHAFVTMMLANTLVWGGIASAIVYCQNKYLGA